MLILFYLLLLLSVVRCTDDLIFETKTVSVGDNVTLNCTRKESDVGTRLYWTRLVSINLPEFLGGTHTFDYDGVNEAGRKAEQGPGGFLLHINDIKPSDAGVYYCFKVNQLDLTFLKGTLLIIEGRKPDITAIIQTSPSDPVHPGDSLTLQCSVSSVSEDKTCLGDRSVHWFRAGSDESHPIVIYSHGNTVDECPEAHSPQGCVYSFSKNISASDAGMYYCAVATCGQILFGNGTKLDVEDYPSGSSICSLTQHATILMLAVSLIVIAFLIYAIKKKKCDCCNDAVAVQNNSGGQKSHQRHDDIRVYSAAVFTIITTEKRDAKAADRERIYAAVKAFGFNYSQCVRGEVPPGQFSRLSQDNQPH